MIAVLADRDPQDVLQLAGAALLLALREHVPTTPTVAADAEAALRRRVWDGDRELADELQAGLGARRRTVGRSPWISRSSSLCSRVI
ncbi:MAG: hypothetical protein ACRDVZ_16080 [Jiangellaceae bacterium]